MYQFLFSSMWQNVWQRWLKGVGSIASKSFRNAGKSIMVSRYGGMNMRYPFRMQRGECWYPTDFLLVVSQNPTSRDGAICAQGGSQLTLSGNIPLDTPRGVCWVIPNPVKQTIKISTGPDLVQKKGHIKSYHLVMKLSSSFKGQVLLCNPGWPEWS